MILGAHEEETRVDFALSHFLLGERIESIAEIGGRAGDGSRRALKV